MKEWDLIRRNWGSGNCFGHCGTVLARGKWGIVGHTGEFRVIRPDGWEGKRTFPTEADAIAYVDRFSKRVKE